MARRCAGLSSTSAGLNANIVVRKVQIELLWAWPALVKYVIEFANDWADALAIKTSKTVPPTCGWRSRKLRLRLPILPQCLSPRLRVARFR